MILRFNFISLLVKITGIQTKEYTEKIPKNAAGFAFIIKSPRIKCPHVFTSKKNNPEKVKPSATKILSIIGLSDNGKTENLEFVLSCELGVNIRKTRLTPATISIEAIIFFSVKKYLANSIFCIK